MPGWPAVLAAGATAAAVLLHPRLALAAFAAFFPIAPAICSALLHVPARAAETLLVALAIGFAARRAVRRGDPAPPRAFAWAAAAFVVVVVVSVAVQAALTRLVLSPAGFADALAVYARTYYDGSRTFNYVVAALPLVCGAAVSVMVAAYTRTGEAAEPVLRMLVTGGAAVACLNIARLTSVLLRTGDAIAALPDVLTTTRISAPYGDPNATGSFFALLLPVAIGLTTQSAGRRRWYYAAVSALIAAALWISGSRAALIAVAVVAIGALVLARRGAAIPKRIGMAMAGAAVLLLLALAFPNPLFDRASTSGALGIRAEMARVATRLWLSSPVLGVGVGQFLEKSGSFVQDEYVRTLYGRENAHNNFLQILAELGAAGAAAFALAVVVALAHPAPFGLRAGLAAFLITCLGGHPLLIPDVNTAFWIVLGAAAAAQPPRESLRRLPLAAALVMAIAVAGAPFAYRTARASLSLDHVGFGVAGWEFSPDGRRYRRSEGDATVFVPRGARQLVVTVRPAGPAALPATFRLWLNDRLADSFVVPVDGWQTYRMTMPTTRGPQFIPLRIAATDKDGRPAPFLLQKVESLP
ncbi:MAG TPA: O-antigen ligase family protein [Vicinamibacterales bacterium]|nr:O-antigen ligase family protein [Vicinamibacterales bacterium]